MVRFSKQNSEKQIWAEEILNQRGVSILLITTRVKNPVSHISCVFFITLCSPDGILSPHMSCSASVINKGAGRELSTKEVILTSSGEVDRYHHSYILLIHCHCDLCMWLYFKPRFPGGTNGKEPGCQCRRGKRWGFDPLAGKILWRRAWQPTPVFLPGKCHGRRSLAGYSPQGCKEWGMTEVNQHACHAVWMKRNKLKKKFF